MTLIGKNIRWFRKQQQISQTEFASIFGITRASVGAYEEGRAEPKLELISRFAKYYNVDLNSFIDKDMSLSNTTIKNGFEHKDQQTDNVPPSASAKSTFVPEILEAPVLTRSSNNDEDKRIQHSTQSSKSKQKDIVYYKSVNDYKYINKAQWPFFSGCDAVFECTPHLERETTLFRDGVFLICVKVNQEGIYHGVFVEQDRERLRLLEGEINKQDDSKNLWRVLYTIDTINSILDK